MSRGLGDVYKRQEYKNASGKEIKVLASFHPAYLLRNPAQKAKAWVDLLRLSKKIAEESVEK